MKGNEEKSHRSALRPLWKILNWTCYSWKIRKYNFYLVWYKIKFSIRKLFSLSKLKMYHCLFDFFFISIIIVLARLLHWEFFPLKEDQEIIGESGFFFSHTFEEEKVRAVGQWWVLMWGIAFSHLTLSPFRIFGQEQRPALQEPKRGETEFKRTIFFPRVDVQAKRTLRVCLQVMCMSENKILTQCFNREELSDKKRPDTVRYLSVHLCLPASISEVSWGLPCFSLFASQHTFPQQNKQWCVSPLQCWVGGLMGILCGYPLTEEFPDTCMSSMHAHSHRTCHRLAG